MAIWNTILWIVGILCAIWVIVDVIKARRMSAGEKAIWIICAILFSIITAIVYYFVKKK